MTAIWDKEEMNMRCLDPTKNPSGHDSEQRTPATPRKVGLLVGMLSIIWISFFKSHNTLSAKQKRCAVYTENIYNK